jgi:hypothetical protein
MNSVLVWVLTFFFIALGVLVPLVQDSFNETVYDTGADDLNDDLREAENVSGFTSFFSIMWSVFSMFLWTFGAIPVYIDLLILVPLRVLYFYSLLSDIIAPAIP